MNDKDQGDNKCKQGLIGVNMTKDQVFSNECWGNREAGYTQAGKQKDKGNFPVFVGVSMKPVEIDVGLQEFYPEQASISNNP